MSFLSQFKNSKDVVNEISRDSSLLVELSPEVRRQFQLFLLSMYKDVKRVCDEHNIRLFIIGGSALGAVRHKGFIPWDDDIDLSMTRSDYVKFVSIFEETLGDQYILNAPNYSPVSKNRFPRIMKKGTYYRTVIDSSDEELHLIYLDLFILENTPDNKMIRKIKGTYCNFLSMMSWEVFIWENRNDEIKEYLCTAGKANYYVRALIGFLFSFRKSYKWFDTYDKAIQYKNENSKYCCLATGRKRYFGEIMKRQQWLPGKTVSFEDEEARIFDDYVPYLINLYGKDYMQLPPEDKRERHSTCELRFVR